MATTVSFSSEASATAPSSPAPTELSSLLSSSSSSHERIHHQEPLLATGTDIGTATENRSSRSRSSSPPPASPLTRARRLLYLSHLFSQFSEVAWQFCLILFLAAFANYESFFLVSTYGIVSGLAVCLTGSKAGKFIDEANRLYVAQTFVWAENVAVLCATLCCYALLARDVARYGGGGTSSAEEDELLDEGDSSVLGGWFAVILEGVPVDATSVSLLIAVHVLGSAAKVLDRGFTVAIERDWIVVMSTLATASPTAKEVDVVVDDDDTAPKMWLSQTNVALKQIDLSCKVVAPALAGFFVAAFGKDGGGGTSDSSSEASSHGTDLRGAALLVGALNVSALVVEYVCTKRIYDLIPDLAVKCRPRLGGGEQGVGTDGGGEALAARKGRVGALPCVPRGDCGDSDLVVTLRRYCGCWRVPKGLKIYMAQPISSGGLALALLYLNILTFGAIMTAYLVWRGMRLETIGVWRGISSAVGLLGTVVFHYSATHLTLEQTGMWSIVFQFTMLTVSYASLFVDDYATSLSMLIAGVCTSRVGLWVFDITITQLMQELIPENARGTVGGVQQALNSFFELFTFVLGILFPDPRYFYVLVFAGYASVGFAMVFYAFGVWAKRNKLR